MRLAPWLGMLVAASATQGCYDAKEYPLMTTIPLSLGDDGAVQASELDIVGHWYAYGDAYDIPARCTALAKYPPAECAEFKKPEPPATDAAPESVQLAHNRVFPSNGTGMCTTGSVEQVLCDGAPCAQDGQPDYSNMWGAGIGLDFELRNDSRGTWNPVPYGVVGIAFDLQVLGDESAGDDLPLTSLRVEFPIQFAGDVRVPPSNTAVRLDGSTVIAGGSLQGGTSEEFPGGSPLWRQKSENDWASLVKRKHNEVFFSDLSLPATQPKPDYPLDFSGLFGVQFHAAPDKDSKKSYGFCIDNLALIRK